MVYNGLVPYDVAAQVTQVVTGVDGREQSLRWCISLAMKHGMILDQGPHFQEDKKWRFQ